MNIAKNHIYLLQDLIRQKATATYRYYTKENQITLLKLIFEELESVEESIPLPKELYFSLSNPENLASTSIETLCNIYKELIIYKTKSGIS